MFFTAHDDFFVRPEIDLRREAFTGYQFEARRELERAFRREAEGSGERRLGIGVRLGRLVAGVGRSVWSVRTTV